MRSFSILPPLLLISLASALQVPGEAGKSALPGPRTGKDQEIRKVLPATVPAELQKAAKDVKLSPPSRTFPAKLSVPPRLILPPVNTSMLIEEDRTNSRAKRTRVGLTRETDISPRDQGEWSHGEAGDLWRLNIVSPQGEALRVHISDLVLPPGAELYLYSRAVPAQIHRFQATGLSADGDFWSALLDGEEVVLELAVPPGLRDAVRFKVTGLGHMYRKAATQPGSDQAGACNLDVSCYPDWKTSSDSVALITFHDAQFIYRCSAVLVNNGANDYSPLLLTANHCLSTDAVAKTVAADWRLRNVNCGPGYDTGYQSLGARVLGSVGPDADTTLLLITGNLPASSAAFAGWTLDVPLLDSNITGVHHPQGGLQKISFGKIIAVNPTWPNTHAIQWSSGTVEPGSSGSPLLNAEHLVMGVLSGGFSSCSNLLAPDYYGKLSAAIPAFQTFMNSGVPDDSMEPNDSRAAAVQVSPPSSSQNLVLKPGDDDWFRFSVTGPKLIYVNYLSPENREAMQMEVYRGQELTPLDLSKGPIPLYEATTQEYFVRLSLPGTVRAEYSFEVILREPNPPTVEVASHFWDYFRSSITLRTSLFGWPGVSWAEWSRNPDFSNSYVSEEKPLFGPEANIFTKYHDSQTLIPDTQYYARGFVRTQLYGTVATPTIAFMTDPVPEPFLVSPADGANLEYFWASLTWGLDSYCPVDVYFGTSPSPPLVVSGLTQSSTYSVANLTPSTKYYWRVACRYEQWVVSSPVRSFTSPQALVLMTPPAVDFGYIFFANTSLIKVPVTVRNNGQNGIFYSVSVSGPFSIDSSTCSEMNAPGATCVVTVAFQPNGQGSSNGILTVDAHPGDFFEVPLTARVGDLALSLSRPRRPLRNSSAAAVQAFDLKLASAGIAATATLGCTGAPVGVSCTVSPWAVQLGGQPATATVTVTTAPRSQRLRSRATRNVVLKVHATIQGTTKTLDLPVEIER